MSEDNVPNNDEDDTAEEVIVPNSKRKDYSANKDMMYAVQKYDEMMLAFHEGGLSRLEENVEWEGEKITAGQWFIKMFSPRRYVPTKKKFADAAGIPYRSFLRYANDDLSKRAKPGTKQGRPKKKTEAELAFAAVAQNAAVLGEQQYSRMLPSALQDAANQNAMNRMRYNRMLHQEMSERFALTPRSPLQKQMWQQYWHKYLPLVCYNMPGGGYDFYLVEIEWMKECAMTQYGLNEVYYIGPEMYETCEKTNRRRGMMRNRIEMFKLGQARQVLTVFSRKNHPAQDLVVVLDLLMEKMDLAFMKHGFEPSDLRSKLREYNENPPRKKRRTRLVDEDKTIRELTLQNFDHPNKSIVEVRNMMGEREDQLRKDIENDEAWLDAECDRIQQAAQAH